MRKFPCASKLAISSPFRSKFGGTVNFYSLNVVSMHVGNFGLWQHLKFRIVLSKPLAISDVKALADVTQDLFRHLPKCYATSADNNCIPVFSGTQNEMVVCLQFDEILLRWIGEAFFEHHNGVKAFIVEDIDLMSNKSIT